MADYLDRVLVKDAASRDVVTISGDKTVGDVRAWFAARQRESTHQGFPILAEDGTLLGVLTRRNLLDTALDERTPVRDLVSRPPAVVYEDNTLREAADHMVRERVGRLPVVRRDAPLVVVGIVSRSDLLSAHQDRLDAAMVTETPPIARGWIRRQAKRRRAAKV